MPTIPNIPISLKKSLWRIVLLSALLSYCQSLESEVATWSQNFADAIEQRVIETMGVPRLQEIVNAQPKTFEYTEGSVKVAALAAQISLIFQKQKNILAKTVSKIQDILNGEIERQVYNSQHDGDQLANSELIESNSKFGTYPVVCEDDYGEFICGSEPVEISTNFSAFKVPSYNIDTQLVEEDLVWSEMLDETFIQNQYLGPSSLRYQYFSSVNGVLRYFPASPWEKMRDIPDEVNTDLTNVKEIRKGTTPLDFDARLSPWFAGTVSGPKNVILIFGISSIFGKEAVLNVLKTISRNDFFAAIYLSENEDPYTLGNSCFHSGKLARGLQVNIDAVKTEIQGIDVRENQVTSQSLVNSFNLAANLVENSSIDSCLTIFIVIADPNESSSSASQIKSSMSQLKAENIPKVFTYTDGGNADYEMMKWIACEYEGLYDSIENSDDASKVGLYYQYLNVPVTDSNGWALSYGYGLREDLFIYTTENAGLEDEQYYTMSYPIYQEIDGEVQLLGVVGLDFDMYDVKNILDAGINGGSTTPILINHEGDTLYHPLQTEYKKLGVYGAGRDITNYEQSQEFSNIVLPGLLNGETEENSLVLERHLPKGDAAVNGIELVSVEMTFYSQAIPGRPLYISLGSAQEDLTETVLTASIYDIQTVYWRILEHYTLFPDRAPKCVDNLSWYYKHLLDTESGSCIYNVNNCVEESVNIAQLYADTKNWSSVVNLIDGCDGNCDPFDVSGTCTDQNSCSVMFYNCKNDHIPGITDGSWCDLNGAPSYMCNGTCICDQNRMTLGTVARWPSNMYAPKCFENPTTAFLMDYSVEFSRSIHDFVNRLEYAQNVDPVLTYKCWRDAIVTFKYIDHIRGQDLAGYHDGTIWLYLGTASGSHLTFPGADLGAAYDPTRQPWYRKAMGAKEKWKYSISYPYMDAGGGGLMNSLSTVIFEEREVENFNNTGWVFGEIKNEKTYAVCGWDLMYNDMNAWLSTVSGCAELNEQQNVYTHTIGDLPMCFILDESGLLLTHTDFMISEAEAIDYVDLKQKEGGVTGVWPIANVFLGEKEPALAAQLIEIGFLVHKTALSEIKDAYLSWYEVDMSVIPESGVLAGTISDQKCYAHASTNWFVSHVMDSNTFLLVVENYEYADEGAARSGECAPVTADPSISIDTGSCEAINNDFSNARGTLTCTLTPYSAFDIEPHRPTDSKSAAGTGKCAEINYPSWGTSTGNAVASVTIILIFAVAIVLGINIVFRRSYILKMSSSIFCILMELGCIVGYFSVLLFIFKPSTVVCHMRVWLCNIAFALIFSPLLAKTWRIHKLFNNAKLKKIRMTNKQLLRWVSGILAVVLVYLVVFSASNQLRSILSADSLDPTILYVSCYSPYVDEWIYANLILCGIMIVFAVFLCIETRHVKAEFNESTQIAIAIYNMFLMGVLITPLVYFMDIHSEAQIILIALGLLSTVTVTWVSIMSPKLLKLNWQESQFRSLESGYNQIHVEGGFSKKGHMINNNEANTGTNDTSKV